MGGLLAFAGVIIIIVGLLQPADTSVLSNEAAQAQTDCAHFGGLQGVKATKSMVRKSRRYTTATCKNAVIERHWEE